MLKKRLLSLLLIFILLLFSFAGCSGPANTEQQSSTTAQTQQVNTQETSQVAQQSSKDTNTSVSGKLTVAYIDVGQGDSIYRLNFSFLTPICSVICSVKSLL